MSFSPLDFSPDRYSVLQAATDRHLLARFARMAALGIERLTDEEADKLPERDIQVVLELDPSLEEKLVELLRSLPDAAGRQG